MSILDLALVAHDTKKDALIAWAERHRSLLSGHRILATGTTGQRLKEAIPELKVERVLSGPLGGDLQIGARIAEKRVDVLIFLIDPLWAQPHEPDVRALMRIAAVHDVPMATNLSTAEALAATFRAAGRQGVVGWRDDDLTLFRPWGFDVGAIDVPVSVWAGRADTMVPVRHGEWLAAHIPGARSHFLEDEGHISLMVGSDRIVDDLLDLAGADWP